MADALTALYIASAAVKLNDPSFCTTDPYFNSLPNVTVDASRSTVALYAALFINKLFSIAKPMGRVVADFNGPPLVSWKLPVASTFTLSILVHDANMIIAAIATGKNFRSFFICLFLSYKTARPRL